MNNLKLTTHNLQHKLGFTLMEIMVTIVILGGLGVVASSSLFSLLRGASKTELVKEIKQNGDYALSVMEIKIRNAHDIVSTCDGSAATSLTIINQDIDRTQTEFACNNGRISQRDLGAPGASPSPTTEYLTNSSVAIPACTTANFSFTCATSTVTGSKNVIFKFTLTQNATVGPAEAVSQTFQIQVTLRNK